MGDAKIPTAMTKRFTDEAFGEKSKLDDSMGAVVLSRWR